MKEISLTLSDGANIGIQGILRGIPFGAALEHWIYGPFTELRYRRIVQTLNEVMARLDDAERRVRSEPFLNLVESIAPDIARAVEESRRERFRDLLVNAARLEPEDAKWEDAKCASELLRQIEPPGMAILAGLGQFKTGLKSLFFRPEPCVKLGRRFTGEAPLPPAVRLLFSGVVLEEWARRLESMRLVHFHSVDDDGNWDEVGLTRLGRFLVDWTVSDRANTASPT